jgi:hypothetical protein
MDGRLYYSCKPCWFDIQDSHEEILYNRCATCSEGDATHRYRQEDGTYLEVCEGCFLLDPETEEEESSCDDCKTNPATQTFIHLDGRQFDLCVDCHRWADHEEDYGVDFGSLPNVRLHGKAKFCECPLPCDFTTPTRCDLCKGIVIVSGSV